MSESTHLTSLEVRLDQNRCAGVDALQRHSLVANHSLHSSARNNDRQETRNTSSKTLGLHEMLVGLTRLTHELQALESMVDATSDDQMSPIHPVARSRAASLTPWG